VRAEFLENHKAAKEYTCIIDGTCDSEAHCDLESSVRGTDIHEDELICLFYKNYSYLSRFYCRKTKGMLCLQHARWYECCTRSAKANRFFRVRGDHLLVYRMPDDALGSIVQKVVEKAGAPEAWNAKMEAVLAEGPEPQLQVLSSLTKKGEKIDGDV
jgi:histone demethylase JARID1